MRYEDIKIGSSLDGYETIVYISDRLVYISSDGHKVILTHEEAKKLAELIDSEI